MKLLVIEDNDLLGRSLKQGLEEVGWTVDLARDGDEARYCQEQGRYDLLLVDRLLPKVSGDELVAEWRRQGLLTPVIFVSAKGALPDRLEGFACGGDDYLVKPFAMAELVARAKALYRRSIGQPTTLLLVAKLELDLDRRQASVAGGAIVLTAKEFDILWVLAAQAGRVLSRSYLHGALYQLNEEPDSNSLDVLLSRVRRKIVGSAAEVVTVRGQGLMIRAISKTP